MLSSPGSLGRIIFLYFPSNKDRIICVLSYTHNFLHVQLYPRRVFESKVLKALIVLVELSKEYFPTLQCLIPNLVCEYCSCGLFVLNLIIRKRGISLFLATTKN